MKDDFYSTTAILLKKRSGLGRLDQSVLLLPPNSNRKGEGGLRKKNYFKYSYKKIRNRWWVYDKEKCIEVDLKNIRRINCYSELPLITVITVVYNSKERLEGTIQSVINQFYPNVEYIIIDGGSVDGTLEVIKRYENYIDYWVSESDKGIYDAMNKGVMVSKGKWVFFLNAGDVFYNDMVLDEIFRTDYKNIEILYGDVVVKYDGITLLKKASEKINEGNIWKGMQFSHQGVFTQLGLYEFYKFNSVYTIAGDYDFVYTVYKLKKRFFYLNKKISVVESGGLSDRRRIKVFSEYYRVVNFYNDLNLYRRCWYGIRIVETMFKILLKNLIPKKFFIFYLKIKSLMVN